MRKNINYMLLFIGGASLLAAIAVGCSTKSGTGTADVSGMPQKDTSNSAAPGAAQGRDGSRPGMGGSDAVSGFYKAPTDERVIEPGSVPQLAAKSTSDMTGRNDQIAHNQSSRDGRGRELADIYFAFDKWTLSEEGKKNLLESAAFLKQHPESKIVIEGYCDERGSREYNLVLGEKRAKESMRYLTALGVKNPIAVTSYGKERQICGEHSETCYWKNRRGHLLVATGQ